MNKQVFILGRFTFNLDGFSADYTYGFERKSLNLCPTSLCRLLTDAGLIEGFDMDANNEPVILFTHDQVRTDYGFDLWSSFVKTFPISYKMAVKLLEYWESRQEHQDYQAKIVSLLSPLQAA